MPPAEMLTTAGITLLGGGAARSERGDGFAKCRLGFGTTVALCRPGLDPLGGGDGFTLFNHPCRVRISKPFAHGNPIVRKTG